MVHGIVIPSLYILAGIVAYATVNHIAFSLNPPRDPVQILFSGICLLAVPFALIHAQMLQATDVTGFVHALKWDLALVILFVGLYAWFIATYTKAYSRSFLVGSSLFFSILFFENLIQPYSLQYDHLDGLHTLYLPWGEAVTRGDGHRGSLAYLASGGAMVILGYSLYVLASLYRRYRRNTDLWMLFAVVLFILSSTEGILARLGVIDFFELAPFGMLGMVMVMSVALSHKQKRAENEIAKLTDWQQTLLDSADYSIISTDVKGIIISFNAAAQRILGYRPEELIGKQTPGIFHEPDEVARRAVELSEELGRTVLPDFEVFVAKSSLGQAEEREWTYIRKDGTKLPVHLSVTPLHGRSGEITGFMGIAADLTESKQAQIKLRDSNARYHTLFDSAGDSIFLMEGDRFIDCNPATLNLFGCTREQIIGEPPYRFSPEFQPDGRFSSEKALEKINAALNGEPSTFEWKHCRFDGTLFDAEVTLNAVNISEKLYLLATVRDITQRKESEKKIHQLAFHDPLTNLPNRQLLMDRLQHALASGVRSGRKGAVLFIDLDNFKSINDTHCHVMGDLLLKQVAERLTACVREGDTVARLGGDEFVVILEDLGEQYVEAAEQIEVAGEKFLSALRQPYQLNSHTFHSSCSIGATLLSADSQEAEELLKQADIAMYQAKMAGRDTLRFFDTKMQEVINARATLEGELHKALERRQFHLHYQVQMDNSNRVVGAEALIRWIHPEHGMISPAQFIPLAEETGLILPIGLWVLDTACAQLKAWQQNSLTQGLTLAVNISARQFLQTDFVAQMQAAIKRYAINPNLLKLELTESMLLEDTKDIISTMSALKAIGDQLSLDDFGTGYSSLQYLKKLPLDQIKIDQSFVRDIATDANDAAIVRAIIAITVALGLDVIAEGVETEMQREFLDSCGCHSFQGYLFGKPVAIEQFEALLQ